MTSIPLADLAGWAALVAAAATVVGMVTLVLFFSRGGPWGPANDASSVVLMLALIPVALALAAIEGPLVGPLAGVVATIGIGPMLVVAVLQALLVARRVTYDQTKYAVLGSGAVVGAWYLLTSIVSAGTAIPLGLRVASGAAGVGFIAVGYGFARGGERHPASTIGGLVLFVASLVVQVWLGVLLLGGGLTIPDGMG